MGDLSQKGVAKWSGLMVNYLYDLAEIEHNHEAYANQHAVVASSVGHQDLAERPLAFRRSGAASAGELMEKWAKEA